MKTLSKKDIKQLIAVATVQKENLQVYAGKGDHQEKIVDTGLKIRHKPTGLVYTVIKPIEDENGINILCHRPGKKLLIHSKDFKDYERQ